MIIVHFGYASFTLVQFRNNLTAIPSMRYFLSFVI